MALPTTLTMPMTRAATAPRRSAGAQPRRASTVARAAPADVDDRDDDDRDDASRVRMTRRASAFAALALGVVGGGVDEAEAFSGEVQLDNVRYEKMDACPPNQYVPNKAKTYCLKFTATATNDVRGRKIEALDVFGFIDDVDGNSAATVNGDGNSRTVLSSYTGDVPPGKSEISFVVTVFKESYEKGPLKLRAFKALGAVADISARFKPFDACEVDPESCL